MTPQKARDQIRQHVKVAREGGLAGTCGRGRSARPLTQQDRAARRATPRAAGGRPRPAARASQCAKPQPASFFCATSTPAATRRAHNIKLVAPARELRDARRLRPRRPLSAPTPGLSADTQQHRGGRCARRSGARSGRASSARCRAPGGFAGNRRPSAFPRRGAGRKPGGRGQQPSAARSSKADGVDSAQVLIARGEGREVAVLAAVSVAAMASSADDAASPADVAAMASADAASARASFADS